MLLFCPKFFIGLSACFMGSICVAVSLFGYPFLPVNTSSEISNTSHNAIADFKVGSLLPFSSNEIVAGDNPVHFAINSVFCVTSQVVPLGMFLCGLFYSFLCSSH